MRLPTIIFSIAVFIGCKPSTAPEDPNDLLFTISVDAPMGDSLDKELVDVELRYFDDDDFALFLEETPVAIQLVDENKAGTLNRGYFQITAAPGEKQLYQGRLSARSSGTNDQVALIMQDEAGEELQTWSSEEQVSLRFDGPVLENRWGAWQLSQSAPYALNAIGKSNKELALAKVSSMDEETNYSDLMDESKSLGIAALGVYNFSDMIPLASGAIRELNVISTGPLVAEVSLIVRGVVVRGEKIDFQMNYRLAAEKPWLEVSMELLTSSDLTLKYGVGLPRHSEASDFIQGKREKTHFAYTYGLQSVGGLHLGNALMVSEKYSLDLYRDNPENHFYLIDPVKRKIDFRVMSVWSGGQQAIADETTFIEYVRKQADAYGRKVSVKVSYP